jgi:hypothetical protein
MIQNSQYKKLYMHLILFEPVFLTVEGRRRSCKHRAFEREDEYKITNGQSNKSDSIMRLCRAGVNSGVKPATARNTRI